MNLNRIKLELTATSMKYPASAVSLIFTPKTLIWNKITFPAPNSLNLAELVVNDLMRSICRKIAIIPFSIRIIAV